MDYHGTWDWAENVRDVAERYFGGVNIKVKGDVFHVTVMLQQGETGEDK